MIYTKFPLPKRDELEQEYRKLTPVYTSLLEKIEEFINSEARSRNIFASVNHRVKDFSSWYAKLLRESSKRRNPAITDVMGIRIICPFLEDVGIVSSLLEELFEVHEIDNKGSDYPYHQFGYESVHFLIRVPHELIESPLLPDDVQQPLVCEVQVRTILQEAWAEVEHELVYKSDFSPLDEPLKRKLAALNANLSLSDIMFQEIRDYQKEFHAAIKQRRKGFYEAIRHDLPELRGPSNSENPEEEEVKPAARAPIPGITHKTFDALLLQGLVAHNDGRLSDAIDIYSGILEQEMSDEIRALILVHRGMAYFTSGSGEKALKDFNRALELNPRYTKARYYRAVHSRLEGKYQESFADLDACIRMEPLNLEYLTGRAETFAESGDIGSALDECRQVINIDPEFKPVKRLLSRLEGTDPGD